MVGMLDLLSTGREFDPWFGRYRLVTLCGQVNHIGMIPTTKVNSAFYPSRVSKLSICLPGLVKVEHVHLCWVAVNTVCSHMAGDAL